MQVQTTLTPETYRLMQMHLAQRSVRIGPNYAGMIGGVFGVSTFLLGVHLTGSVPIAVAMIAYGLIFYIAVIFALRKKHSFSMTTLGAVYYGEHTYEAMPDGLHITSALATKVFKYESFVEVVQIKDQLLIMCSKWSGFHVPITDANREAVRQFKLEMLVRVQPRPA